MREGSGSLIECKRGSVWRYESDWMEQAGCVSRVPSSGRAFGAVCVSGESRRKPTGSDYPYNRRLDTALSADHVVGYAAAATHEAILVDSVPAHVGVVCVFLWVAPSHDVSLVR